MSRAIRRILAAVILILLVVVPFLDWKLGAVLWMCAWLVFIFQNLYSGRHGRIGPDDRSEGEQQE